MEQYSRATRHLLLFIALCCCTVGGTTSHAPRQALSRSAHPQEYVLSPDFKITAAPTTRQYTLVVTNSMAALDGFLRPVLAINDQVPGPLIEANDGDRLEITVINKLTGDLTMHWHGLYQNGTNWEDGVTGVTQCPIPPNGGQYTYKFNLSRQAGTFWYHAHQQNLMADGLNGPLIIHSPWDPLKRSVDFDQEVVLMMSDWYHNTSTQIVTNMLTEAGYFGSPAAPGPNAALINGVGKWNCSFATASQECQSMNSPPEFVFKAGEKIRFRLINAGVHAMFYYSVDQHTLNVTEADGTGIYGPTALHRLKLHNGQRYSVVIKTKKADAGKSFYIRAEMDSDCWTWVPEDVQLTGFGIIRLIDDSHPLADMSHTDPKTSDWPDALDRTCIDIEPSRLVPILKRNVPKNVVGSGSFANAFGYQVIATGDIITRAEAVQLAANASTSNSTSTSQSTSTTDKPDDGKGTLTGLAKRGLSRLSPSLVTSALDKRQVKVGKVDLPAGKRPTPPGYHFLGGPPPTPVGSVGKFFVNNITWLTYPYQPVLHDLTPGGVGTLNSSEVANVVYPTADWYDLYLVNLDPALTHPYHLHAMDMHVVATGKGLPTPENLANLTYNTENPLRRDTIVIDAASFAVVRLLADIPGTWIMHCHIGWHLAGGFAGVVVVQPDVIKSFKIPDDNMELCKSRVGPLDTIEPGLAKRIKKRKLSISRPSLSL